jgi:olefin beta-lactone synthetase
MDFNVGRKVSLYAANAPDQIAIASPQGSHRQRTHRTYETISFRDLDRRSSSIAAGLQGMGMGPGQRIALLVRFGEDFITLVFALLKAGVTLVLIDPGMGRKNLLRCLSAAEPDGFVALPQAHAIRWWFAKDFPKARLNVTVGRRYGYGPSPTLSYLEKSSPNDYRPVDRSVRDSAAIIFTTGSTGPPKGVLYSHGTFHHQIEQLVQHYGISQGSIDLSCFPLFGLFNAVMGTTTILPDMNPIRPADVDPPRLLDAIDQWSIRQSFGSPALWTAVGTHCQATGRKVESLQRILSAGAPVSPRILRWMRAAMRDDGEMHTPYGATEALPIASIESREVLGETAAMAEQGRGTCVGNRFTGIEWRVIGIQDGPIQKLEDTQGCRAGEIGELMVSGPVISPEYVTRLDQNALHKVHDGERIWHRMGDVGYLDDRDRFWYCGRKSHRVRSATQTLFTEPCEAIINTHPSIYRTALVGIGTAEHQHPVAIVEPWPAKRPRANSTDEQLLIDELQHLAQAHSVTASIQDIRIYPRRLPTDIRHNSKIFREQLVPWAERGSQNPTT